jgi:hypothetical protein
MSAYRELVFTATASPIPAIWLVIQLKSFMMFDAFTTSMKCSSARRYVNTSSTNVPAGVGNAE